MEKTKSNLVRLTTQDVSKALPITDTTVVAEKLEIQHKNVIAMVRKYQAEFEEFGGVAFETQPFKTKGGIQMREVALLNEEQFIVLITYSKNTSKARYWKRQFVKNFVFMRKELQARRETRHIAVEVRKSLTDSIKENVIDEGRFKTFAYSNYTKLIYKTIFKKSLKDIKKELDLSKDDNIRDFLTTDQLKLVQDMESKIATRIEVLKELHLSDKETYKKIKEIIPKINLDKS